MKRFHITISCYVKTGINRGRRRPLLFFCALILTGAFLSAQNAAFPPGLLLPFLETAPAIRTEAAVLMDAETGTVLYAKNPDREIPPASLTKLMTMHIAFSEAAARSIDLDAPVEIGREAWAINQPPRSSLMFLAPGQRVSLRELLLGLAIPSGNDAAVAVALRFAPDVSSFVSRMNSEAKRMGMRISRFTEPAGISENNSTTAAEFALFCRQYLYLHPEALAEYHSVEEFAYPKPENVGDAFKEKPGVIVQHNRNGLLGKLRGVDGLKTGYIDEAGYNIALTASRDATRFILVLLGAPARPGGDRIRDEDGAALLNWAFENFKTIRPAVPEIAPIRLWKGRENHAELSIGEAPPFTIPSGRGAGLSCRLETAEPLIAPLSRGEKAGELVFLDEYGELRRIPLLSVGDYERGNIFKRLFDSIRLFFRRIQRSPA
ncbi:MAG: D-alanyl-D-alanine carboxypeptidase [Treponema sp.]|jgi:D-alanyl-D-alanine carboxypeptidase (penicillin-binding protein 5/6)|nr:D-alanyl-D-alanine carboxypeptidase [Treponema sp.]